MKNSKNPTKTPPAIPPPTNATRPRSRWPSAYEESLETKPTPRLRFNPTAWAKLLFLRDYSLTEVGGFGIAAMNDLLYVEDISLVQQKCTGVSVAFDDVSVADFYDQQVDAGLPLERFSRIWVHTHPGDSPRPSSTDEATFLRVFGRNDWAVMFILAEGGQSYARLQFGVGPGGSLLIPVVVDYSRPFASSDYGTWEQEYLDHVQEIDPPWADPQPLSSRQMLKAFDFFEEDRNPAPLRGDRRFDILAEEEAWEEYLDFQGVPDGT
jgi:hypothetical protein